MMKGTLLNLGCGFNKIKSTDTEEWINVDAFEICKPDLCWNLDKFPYPWEDNSIDRIVAFHVMEHLHDWWGAFSECVRILKPMGSIEIRVPHPSDDTAFVYRDHFHVINLRSFIHVFNIRSFDSTNMGPQNTSSGWFEEQKRLPVKLVGYNLVAWPQYQWLPNRVLKFCADHLRNFIYEQRITFQKV